MVLVRSGLERVFADNIVVVVVAVSYCQTSWSACDSYRHNSECCCSCYCALTAFELSRVLFSLLVPSVITVDVSLEFHYLTYLMTPKNNTRFEFNFLYPFIYCLFYFSDSIILYRFVAVIIYAVCYVFFFFFV